MGSSRLPGKPLLPVGDRTALDRLIGNLRRCRSLADLVIATSTLLENDPLVAEAKRLGVSVYRGDEHDVAGRLYHAGVSAGGTAIARVTADDVLMDPAVVDLMVNAFHEANVDCVTSLTSRSFPNGFVLSVIDQNAMARLTQSNLTANEREHVIPGFLARPDAFTTLSVAAPPAWSAYEFGATLDTPADLQFVRDLIVHFGDTPRVEQFVSLVKSDLTWSRRAAAAGRYWEAVDA
jgi:spore coat polysaccharide biosynthesis protein SpsF